MEFFLYLIFFLDTNALSNFSALKKDWVIDCVVSTSATSANRFNSDTQTGFLL